MNIFNRTKQFSRVAFSAQEQALTSLSILFYIHGYNKSSSRIRKGRTLEKCQYQNLESLASESGFYLKRITGENFLSSKDYSFPLILDIHKEGTVLLEKSRNNKLSTYNPLTGRKATTDIEKLINTQLNQSYMLTFQSRKKENKYNENLTSSSLFTLLLTEKNLRKAAYAIIFMSLLHALTKLVDPITKNLFMTIVVQGNDISWARSLAWIYFLVGVLGSFILLLSGVVSILLLTRLSLKYSFSTLTNLMRVPNSYLKIREKGDLMNRVRSSEAIAGFIGSSEVQLIGSLINLLILITFLASTSLTLAFLLFVFQLIGFVFTLFTASPLKKRTDMHIQRVAQETSSLLSNLSFAKAIKRQSKTDDTFRFHQLKINSRVHAQQKLSIFSLTISYITSSLDSIQSVSLLTIACLLIIDGQVSLGQYVAFSAIMSNVIGPFKNLAAFVKKFQHIKTIEDRVMDISEESLLMEDQLGCTNSAQTLIRIQERISDKNGPDHSVLVNTEDLPAIMLVNDSTVVSRIETYLSGDDLCPPRLIFQKYSLDPNFKLLIARTTPHVFNMSWDENISLWNKPITATDKDQFNQLVSSIHSPDDPMSSERQIGALTPGNIAALGILRALWLKPDCIIIPLQSVLKEKEKKLLCQDCLNYCNKNKIKVLFLTDVLEFMPDLKVVSVPEPLCLSIKEAEVI